MSTGLMKISPVSVFVSVSTITNFDSQLHFSFETFCPLVLRERVSSDSNNNNNTQKILRRERKTHKKNIYNKTNAQQQSHVTSDENQITAITLST